MELLGHNQKYPLLLPAKRRFGIGLCYRRQRRMQAAQGCAGRMQHQGRLHKTPLKMSGPARLLENKCCNSGICIPVRGELPWTNARAGLLRPSAWLRTGGRLPATLTHAEGDAFECLIGSIPSGRCVTTSTATQVLAGIPLYLAAHMNYRTEPVPPSKSPLPAAPKGESRGHILCSAAFSLSQEVFNPLSP